MLGGKVPEERKKSMTILIPKKNKPTVFLLTPIALTDVCYKILMGVIKMKLQLTSITPTKLETNKLDR